MTSQSAARHFGVERFRVVEQGSGPGHFFGGHHEPRAAQHHSCFKLRTTLYLSFVIIY